MARKITNGVYIMDAPTVYTCMDMLRDAYPTMMWNRYRVKQFHSMSAFVADFVEPNCSTYFISYWTPLAHKVIGSLEIIADPYAYSASTSRQFNRWLRETYGDTCASEIECAIRNATKYVTPTPHHVLNIDIEYPHVMDACFISYDK